MCLHWSLLDNVGMGREKNGEELGKKWEEEGGRRKNKGEKRTPEAKMVTPCGPKLKGDSGHSCGSQEGWLGRKREKGYMSDDPHMSSKSLLMLLVVSFLLHVKSSGFY